MKANQQLMARRARRPAEQGDQGVSGRIDGPRGQRSGDPGQQSKINDTGAKSTNGAVVMSRTTTLTWYAPSTVCGTQVKVLVGLKSRTICAWPLKVTLN